MDSPFLLWPDNAAPSKPDPTPQPAPRTRSKKGSKPAVAKRAPQRGLGVAQLERLRIEESFKEVVPHQTQRALMAGTYQAGNGLPGLYQIEQGYNVVRYEGAFGRSGAGTGFVIPAGAGPVPVPEPPSNQMVVKAAAQVVSVPQMDLGPSSCTYSDQCEFCVRKKRLFGESSMYQTNCVDFRQMDLSSITSVDQKKRLFGESSMYQTNCVDFRQMDLSSITSVDQEGIFSACTERKRSSPSVQRPTKEYQFFPIFGDRSEMANPMGGNASTSASSASFHPSQLLDLSLKL